MTACRLLSLLLAGLALAFVQGVPLDARPAPPVEAVVSSVPLPPGAVRRFGGYAGPLRFALTPDGSNLVIGDRAGKLDVWDVATGKLVRQLDEAQPRGEALVRMAPSPDGRLVAVGKGHCEIYLYRLDGRAAPQRIVSPFRLDGGWMSFLEWAPDGKSLFACGSGMIICRVNLADGQTVWGCGDEDMPSCALAPDGRVVLVAEHDTLQILDAPTGKEKAKVRLALTPEQKDPYPSLGAPAFAADGKQLAVALGSHTVALCDASGGVLRTFTAAEEKQGPPSPKSPAHRRRERFHRVDALAFSPDGKWIVSGADDCSVRVWESATGKLVVRFAGEGLVKQVAFVPDGRSLFSAGEARSVCQWDLTPRPYARPRRGLEDLWAATGEADPAQAVPAAWALVTGSEEARKLVAEKLPPEAVKDEEIARWLADLDSPVFAQREEATKALASQGRAAQRQLREALKKGSTEVRRRARDLLAGMQASYTAQELRALRLVQACELSGTPAARALLKRWAGGALGAVLTEDAQAALARLERRR